MGRWLFRIVPVVIALLVMAWQFLGAERFTNPETGRTARIGMSPEQEQALGAQAFQQVLAQSPTLSSGPEVELVRRVATRLARVADAGEGPDFQWEVAVVRDPQVNAFCLPGGKICVYTGILPIAANEDGLAAVLGHEMAHATCRHGAERVFKQDMTQTALLGLQGSLGGMDIGQQRMLMGLIGAGAQYGVLLPFSRDHELEADRLGLRYMARAGYDPREAIGLWRRMGEASPGGQPPEFASTHPAHETRIQRIESWLPEVMPDYERAKAVADKGP